MVVLMACHFCGEVSGCKAGVNTALCSECAWYNECERMGLKKLYKSKVYGYCPACTDKTMTEEGLLSLLPAVEE